MAYIESANSSEVSKVPSIYGGGSYENPSVPGTFLPGFTFELKINDVAVSIVIVDTIVYNLDSTASTCTFRLPRRFDDFGTITYGDTIKVWVNERYVFNGTVRNIIPSIQSRGETVTVTAADDRVKMDGLLFTNGGLSKVIYNDRNPSTARTDQTTYYATAYSTAEDIIDDIMARITAIATDREGAVPDELDVGTLEFTDVNCGRALDMVLERVGDYKWFLTPDNEVRIFKQSEDDISRDRKVWVGELGQLASNYNVTSCRLNKSYANIVNKVIFVGNRTEVQSFTLLDPDWSSTLEDTWNLDNKDDETYRDVYRKFTIMGSMGSGLKNTLITHPDKNAVVYYYSDAGEWETVGGFSIDYNTGIVTFQEPQTRITDMETGEVEKLPLRIMYAYYGDSLTAEATATGPYNIVKVIRDEDYTSQAVSIPGYIARLLDAPEQYGRDDTAEAQLRANEELERLNQPVISGTIITVGDETWDIWKRVSIEGATGAYATTYSNLEAQITRIIHNLSSGFTTTINITTEKPLFGLGRLRDRQEAYRLTRIRDRVLKAEERLLRREGKSLTFHNHTHEGSGTEGGLSYAIYHDSS